MNVIENMLKLGSKGTRFSIQKTRETKISLKFEMSISGMNFVLRSL